MSAKSVVIRFRCVKREWCGQGVMGDQRTQVLPAMQSAVPSLVVQGNVCPCVRGIKAITQTNLVLMFSYKVQLKPEVTEVKRRTTSIVGHHDIWVNGQGKLVLRSTHSKFTYQGLCILSKVV